METPTAREIHNKLTLESFEVVNLDDENCAPNRRTPTQDPGGGGVTRWAIECPYHCSSHTGLLPHEHC